MSSLQTFMKGFPNADPAGEAQIHGVYEHHKGGLYRVLMAAMDATNGRDRRWVVVYVSMTYGEVYVRDVDEFLRDEVVWPDGTKGPRFRWIGHARSSPNR